MGKAEGCEGGRFSVVERGAGTEEEAKEEEGGAEEEEEEEEEEGGGMEAEAEEGGIEEEGGAVEDVGGAMELPRSEVLAAMEPGMEVEEEVEVEVEVEVGIDGIVGIEGIVGMVGIVEAVETGGEVKGTPLGESTLERMRSHDGESIHSRSQSPHRLHGSKKRLWRKIRWTIYSESLRTNQYQVNDKMIE